MTKHMSFRELADHAISREPRNPEAKARLVLSRAADATGRLLAALVPFSTLAWIFIMR